MTDLMAVFPGQGSQSIGMGKDLLSEFPYTSDIFEEAEDSAKLSIRSLCAAGPLDQLTLTENQQPCIFAVSAAYWFVLRQEAGIYPGLVAGHSLGEYSALYASGRLSLAEIALLVRKRGQFMQQAVPEGVGAMAAVLKFDPEELVALCRSVATLGICEVVNFNSPFQQIISGHKGAVEQVCKLLKEKKIRCMPLPVSAPFHSSLMKPAAENMRPLLDKVAFKESDCPIAVNLTGEIVSDYEPDFLIKQIDHPVLWTKILNSAYSRGMRRFIEVGPGKVLTGLVKKSLSDPKIEVKNTESIKEIIQYLCP